MPSTCSRKSRVGLRREHRKTQCSAKPSIAFSYRTSAKKLRRTWKYVGL